MEGSRKRKATNATPSTSEGSASKKLRLLNSSAPTGKSNVQQVGERIIEQLHNASDKTGRPIATQFISLPDRDDLPEYYDIIKLPLALDTIEEKVQNNDYPTVTTLESDLKRLIQNAKDFNDPKSEIFEDAERIRKLVFNFMKVNNPAYKENPKYSAFPTPLPEGQAAPIQNGLAKASSESVRDRRGSSVKAKAPTPARASEQPGTRSSMAPSAATGEDEADEDGDEAGAENLDLTGKSFQEAQQAIISYLLRHSDDEGFEIYTPFGNLPSRSLVDYYKLIRHPVCLKSVAKRVRGQHGRAPPTGVTDFKTWDAFGDEVSFIWRNAQEYNEDGSDMYVLADEFKEHFQSLLAEAKEKVEEPSAPRIKLGGPKPKVMLNLAQHRGSPAPGFSVDNEALARQKQMVQAGVNGQQTGHAPTVNGTTPAVDGPRPPSSAHSGSPARSTVKLEKSSTQSPAPPNLNPSAQPLTNGMMPPPVLRPSSATPYTQPAFNIPVFLPPTPIRNYPVESALLPRLTIQTHPHLKVPHPFSMTITPHATLSHQSSTISLPSTHYFLQISPTISKQLSSSRPYKLFVTVNGTRLTQRDTWFDSETSRRTHVYEGSLAQGVNRVEVEVVAAKEGGEEGLDVEKVTALVSMMR